VNPQSSGQFAPEDLTQILTGYFMEDIVPTNEI